MLFIFTFAFAFLSLFIYVEFGWKTYVLVDFNPGMRCKRAKQALSVFTTCTLCVLCVTLQASLLFFPESLIFTCTRTLQHIQHPPLSHTHTYIHTYIHNIYDVIHVHTYTHSDYYRVYQVFMSVLKLFLLFLVGYPSRTMLTMYIVLLLTSFSLAVAV